MIFEFFLCTLAGVLHAVFVISRGWKRDLVWCWNGKQRHKGAYSCADAVAAADKISSSWSQPCCIYRWPAILREPGTHTHTYTHNPPSLPLFFFFFAASSLWGLIGEISSLGLQMFPNAITQVTCPWGESVWLSSESRPSRQIKVELRNRHIGKDICVQHFIWPLP